MWASRRCDGLLWTERDRKDDAVGRPHRNLIGDDEHVWTDRGVFNIEGGCYAKAIGLNPKTEKDIYDAVRFGAVAENCVLDKRTGEIDFYDESICKNTRVAYPLSHIEGALSKAIAGHPKNVIFLTNDAFGVMPPVARLTSAQAMFWFVMGYTANVQALRLRHAHARPIFSSCFGGPFLVRHRDVLRRAAGGEDAEANSRVWLLNTGYAGGRADRGAKRMPLRVTRAIIDAIHDGTLAGRNTRSTPAGACTSRSTSPKCRSIC
ncbi:Phosphoenolpyruvate carboxykinase [ATP], glycosomal [Trypanosoma cruzi]|uniref:Phosphoenolpyruvate carboxykinase [ATP], glycosomal n=1 Tax=Trypanosoma cruzi TaxID=5693 RepID=A0A2V2WFY6_TRYCR|nr:Phosphoenolpyruvate carboxykinase [ATP], glycosomal [Trypanosoma cruzi]